MKSNYLFDCEVYFFNSPWLNQIYDGFEKLRKRGYVKVKYKKIEGDSSYPVLKVLIDGEYLVAFDMLDGIGVRGISKKEKIDAFFHDLENIDFCFKRSFLEEFNSNSINNCKVFPLGLNYHLNMEHKFKGLKKIISNSKIFKKLYPKYNQGYPSEIFEYYPIAHKLDKIIFYAKLWDPDEPISNKSKREREHINYQRLSIIKACKDNFPTEFQGGIINGKYSSSFCDGKYLAPNSDTIRRNYLQKVKDSNICISSTGLHGSIGWNMGEYVAASRAIVSMPLNYQLPGGFNEGVNYLSFSSIDEMLEKIEYLLMNKDAQSEMMINNFNYYNSNLRPDFLILNSLFKVYNEINS